MAPGPDSEARIIAAATQVFIQHGRGGARMQEIADLARINKAMLHYYFKTKDALFDRVFDEALRQIVPVVVSFVSSPDPIDDKITRLVDGYFDALLQNPTVPTFILNELQRNPQRLKQSAKQQGLDGTLVQAQLNKAAATLGWRKLKWESVLTTVAALAIFPFAAQPLLMAVTGMNREDFGLFLADRRRETHAIVRAWLGG